jgi:hypothetical protein
MMKRRSGISRTWNIRNSMNPKDNEKHEEEHERNQNNQSLYQESQDYQPDMNSLKAIKQKN